MKARVTNMSGALLKMRALALICPSALMMAQREVGFGQANQSPRPAYHPNPPAPGTQNGQGGNVNQPRAGGAQKPTLNGKGMRPTDQFRQGVPPGHLADWLNQHRNLPPAQQEQLLLKDPTFLRLNPMEQRKVLNQLHQMETMNDQQLQRRLARAELIEHLSPADKIEVNASAERMRDLPPERRQMLRRAFQDLRGVPMEDRDMVLSSAYYRKTYSPAERIILHDVLRVEPYEPVVPR